MLLDVGQIFAKHRFKPRGVIQAGAHLGQELEKFVAMGIGDGLFFEPLPHIFDELAPKIAKIMPRGIAFPWALGSTLGRVTMSVEDNPKNRGMSSSCLKPKLHTKISPDIVFTRELEVEQVTLDWVFERYAFNPDTFDFLSMDVQGYEGEVLRGAETVLPHIRGILTEVNCAELYEGCIELPEMDAYLGERGFTRVATHMACKEWGDAVYVRVK